LPAHCREILLDQKLLRDGKIERAGIRVKKPFEKLASGPKNKYLLDGADNDYAKHQNISNLHYIKKKLWGNSS
jgi:hypothetical protein